MIPWGTIAIVWFCTAILMSELFVLQRTLKNAGIVDIAWSACTAASGCVFAAISHGDLTRRVVVATMATVWGLRLASHLLSRCRRETEDGRYVALRAKWGARANVMMFGLYQIQALWAVLFSLPMLAASWPRRPFSTIDIVAVLIYVGSIVGETTADRQLAAFKASGPRHSEVCRTGLWAWSRHPNYFFEWFHWLAYICLASGTPLMGIAIAGAIVMFLFLTRVTGVPMTEAQAVRSRGDAYRKYQQEVSPFVPLPPGRFHA